ncbi:EAL domain-containing protein [Paenalcaligenes sp. Me131]|uniref:EAL domain-containing protein n=1 Tax=Paenalcaligenes sp. Me131 TaxID=3392636 RepID=UPI003D27FDC7
MYSLFSSPSHTSTDWRVNQRKQIGGASKSQKNNVLWTSEQVGLLITRNSLLNALEQKQIQAWLQPKIAVGSQQLVAVEALARWSHPEWGVLTPDVFLPWFESYDLDEALLMHMLEEALAFQTYWREQGVVIPVAVNLPTHLLDDSTLPQRLGQFVEAKQGRHSDISFELLETSDTATTHALFTGVCSLADYGFGLALDDFGVDYGSMQRLLLAPFSELKLDRSLVQGVSDMPERAELVRTAIRTSKQRGLKVTAEGVETQAELAFLQQAGCDYAQGYMFAKPLPVAELATWMRQHGAV